MRLYDAGCRVEKHVRQVQRTRGHFMGLTEPFRRQVLVAQVQPATGYRRIPQLCDAALIGKECLVGQTWIVEPAYEDDLTASENRWTQAVRVQRVARADGCIGVASAVPVALST